VLFRSCIAAESAERRDGEFTVFNNGVYTACEECKKDPSKPPLWQVRARKITINNETRAVEYEEASFEFFGVPVLYMHRFAHADPSVKRKSGFLFPRYEYTNKLGHSVRNAYFFNLAPNYDVTLAGTYYSRQGFLSEAEWRHRTISGQYNLKFAKIAQNDPDAFHDASKSYRSVDEDVITRHAIMTDGKFKINPRWTFGWNALFQSDENFARTYGIAGFTSRDITNEIYLTGLNGKNYFDLRGQDFLIQDQNKIDYDRYPYSWNRQTQNDQQATVVPVLDYNIVSDEDQEYGQVSLDINVTSLKRDANQIVNSFDTTPGRFVPLVFPSTTPIVSLADNPVETAQDERFHGIRGNYTRASANLEWKNSVITEQGALVTASLGIRGDGIFPDTDDLNTEVNPLLSNDSIFRAMPTGTLEIRYPMIADDGLASHIFEPIAQLIVRPDETHIGMFPNEDAQSLVFDASNLFELDKFSGYDRVEGGTRANVGFRYSASFEDGANFTFIAGQSFHLAGQNSFAQKDLVNVGMESGLESQQSDYVAALQIANGHGITLGASGRFDEQNLDLLRSEVSLTASSSLGTLNTSYIFTDAQPNYALKHDRHEVRGSASINITENWKVLGKASYDLFNGSMISEGIGLSYNDECYSFSLNYTNNRKRTGEAVSQTIGFRIGLRTIGGFGHKYKLPSREENNTDTK